MPTSSSVTKGSVALIWGDDEYSIKLHAKHLYEKYCAEWPGLDHEIIDGTASNSSEALKCLARLQEAIQTLPFFSSGKVIWFQNCNFLGDERAASSAAVTDFVASLAQEWKSFDWKGVRLIISAGKVDKRRVFYKTLEKIALVENYSELSFDDKEWIQKAERIVSKELIAAKKEMGDAAMAEFISLVGPSTRLLVNEIEKLILFIGDRPIIEIQDINKVTTRQKQSKAFALSEALGDRNLLKLLKALDEELWEMRTDTQKSAIGILYGLITKVRVLLFIKEAVRLGWLKADAEWGRFKSQLEKLPTDLMPSDKRLNPLTMHPYVLFKALPQVKNYSMQELIQAMEMLLECNIKLISSSQDDAHTIQQTLINILKTEKA